METSPVKSIERGSLDSSSDGLCDESIGDEYQYASRELLLEAIFRKLRELIDKESDIKKLTSAIETIARMEEKSGVDDHVYRIEISIMPPREPKQLDR